MLAASVEARDLPTWFVCARFRDVPLGARALTSRGSARARTFSIGAGAVVDAPVPLAAGGRHALVTAVSGGCEVRPAAGMLVELGGRAIEVAEGAAVLVPSGTRALVRRDDVVVSVEPLEGVPVVGSGAGRSPPAEVATHALALVPFALVALLLTFLPPDARTLGLSVDAELETRRLPIIFVPQVDSGRSVVPLATGGPAKTVAPGERRDARPLPTNTARRVKRPGEGQRAFVGTSPSSGAVAATSAGILGVLTARKTAALHQIFDRDAGGLSLAALGGLEGGGDGAGWDGPLGPSGSGAGGAGEGTGTMGDPGAIGSSCPRGRPCLGGRLDGPAAKLGPRALTRIPDVTGALKSVRGRLERDAVRRVVRLHMNEVRACYDRALLRAPSLDGRLVVGFVVGPDGVVRSAIAEPDSTVSDAGFRSCVADAVRRWSFPAVPDGGVTVVSYPFVFAPAGG